MNKNNIDRDIENRKAEHIKLVAERNVAVDNASNGFELFEVVPTAIPNINFNEISLKSKFLDKEFSAPILVAGMTGGYSDAQKINTGIGRVCAKLGIPMGVGSQRAMILNDGLTPTFDIKSEVPDLFLIGNLGLVQFCNEFDINDYHTATEKIAADAMALHVNAFQELCQPEGDINFNNAWGQLEMLCKESAVPVIGKEVGSGIAWEEVVRMEQIGCQAVDVGGSGGTSWAKIELMRYEGDELPFTLDDPTLHWGIPTAFATWEATEKTNVDIIATGGMYHGLMAAKALAMGASLVGIARPVLQAFMSGGESLVEKWLLRYMETIKSVMFLMGTASILDLKQTKSQLIPTGKAREWLLHRKIIV
ncbi:MAG: type 2 isopentenyl-diphosphate Delta-isomerase [Candidatus Kariarchaeaceae archaeon]|jgi:isopentenyl-diphosphate delta-isomerase